MLPGHVEVVDRLLYEPLTRSDLQTLGRLLDPVREHMRAAPRRSATARRGAVAQAGGGDSLVPCS